MQELHLTKCGICTKDIDMNECNGCGARDREITRQLKEVVRWKSRAATYKKQSSKKLQAKTQDQHDAARYRWLRSGKYSIDIARSILNDTPNGIDDAIDAAMLKTPNV